LFRGWLARQIGHAGDFGPKILGHMRVINPLSVQRDPRGIRGEWR